MKTCCDCKQVKDVEADFYKRTTRKGTKIPMSMCKPCTLKRARDWQTKNKERYKEYHRQYHLKKKV